MYIHSRQSESIVRSQPAKWMYCTFIAGNASVLCVYSWQSKCVLYMYSRQSEYIVHSQPAKWVYCTFTAGNAIVLYSTAGKVGVFCTCTAGKMSIVQLASIKVSVLQNVSALHTWHSDCFARLAECIALYIRQNKCIVQLAKWNCPCELILLTYGWEHRECIVWKPLAGIIGRALNVQVAWYDSALYVS